MKKKLLPISMLLVLSLVGCDEKKQPDDGKKDDDIVQPSRPDVVRDESEPEGAAVSITNKDVLKEKWYVNASKSISITLTPERNPLQELKQDHLSITCNDADAFDITGLGLKAKKTGKFTITAKYWSKVDTVEVEISELAPEPAKVTTTVSNLLDNWDTLVAKEKGTLFEIEAVITGWAAGKEDGQKYGNFFIGDAVDSTKTIYVYGCSSKLVIEWKGTEAAYSYTQGDDAKDWLTSDMTKNAVIGGKVKIQCIAYSYSGTKEVSAKLISYEAPPKVDPETIKLAKSEITLEVGKSNSVKANLGPTGAVGTVEWSSSDTTVATVDATGKITAVKAGEATITAKVKDFNTVTPATLKVNVVAADDSVTMVTTPAVDTAYKLGVAQYNLLFDNKDLLYFFTGKMNGNYLDTGIYSNSVDVKLEQAGETAGNYYMYFNDPANNNAKTYIEQKMVVNKDKQYVNAVLTTETPTSSYVWNADLKTLVTNGIVKDGKAANYAIGTDSASSYNTVGPRDITASSFYVNLYAPVADKALTGVKCKDVSLNVGETTKLVPYANPVSANLGTVTYESEDTNKATVDANGVVTAVSDGEVKIVVRAGDYSCTATVNVMKPLTAAEALTKGASECKDEKTYSSKKVTVKGKLVPIEGYFNNGTGGDYVGKYNIVSGDKELYVVNSKQLVEGVRGNVDPNDEVIVTGYLYKEEGVIEFYKKDNDYPEIKSVIKGTGSFAIDTETTSDKATINLPEVTTGTNRSDFTFTVTAADGYKVSSVKVGGVEVNPDDSGNYVVKFVGDQKICAETILDGEIAKTFVNNNGTVEYWTEITEKEFTCNGINFKSEGLCTAGSATNKYSYWMLKPGYMATTSCPENCYIKSIVVTYTGGTSEAGTVVIEFSATPNAAKSKGTTGFDVKKNESRTAENTDTSKKYVTISNISTKNVQFASITITYARIPA